MAETTKFTPKKEIKDLNNNEVCLAEPTLVDRIQQQEELAQSEEAKMCIEQHQQEVQSITKTTQDILVETASGVVALKIATEEPQVMVDSIVAGSERANTALNQVSPSGIDLKVFDQLNRQAGTHLLNKTILQREQEITQN